MRRWLTLVLDLVVGGEAVLVIGLALSLRHTTSPGLLGVSMNAILCEFFLFLFPFFLSPFLPYLTNLLTARSLQHQPGISDRRVDGSRNLAGFRRPSARIREICQARSEAGREQYSTVQLACQRCDNLSRRHCLS